MWDLAVREQLEAKVRDKQEEEQTQFNQSTIILILKPPEMALGCHTVAEF